MHEIARVDRINVLEAEQKSRNPVMKYFVWMRNLYGPPYAALTAEMPASLECVTKSGMPPNVLVAKELPTELQSCTIDQLKVIYPCPRGV